MGKAGHVTGAVRFSFFPRPLLYDGFLAGSRDSCINVICTDATLIMARRLGATVVNLLYILYRAFCSIFTVSALCKLIYISVELTMNI